MDADVSAIAGGFNPLDLLPFLVVLAAAYVAAKTLNFALKKAARHFVGKTKTILDDLLLEALDLPITIALTAVALYVSAEFSGLSGLPWLALAGREFAIALGAYTAYVLGRAFLRWYVVEVAPAKNLPLADMEPTIRRVMALFIISIALIMALDTAGLEVSPLIASMGIAGLAVALAFQDTLGNFFAGVYISLDRPVREGDYIQLDSGQEGYVQKIGWRSTQIRMLANNIIVMPNSRLASSIITNYYSPDKDMSVVIPVSVAYDADLERVEKVAVQVARKMQKTLKGAVPDFEPFIRYNSFGDSGIGFSVVLRVREYTEKYLVTHEFIKALHSQFRKDGLEIPFPKRDIYIKGAPGFRKGKSTTHA